MASTEVERPITVEITQPECPAEPKCLEPEGPELEKKEDKTKTDKTPEKKRASMNNQQQQQQQQQSNQQKRSRHDNEGRHFKFGRKRTHSFTGGNSKFVPPHKRWKRDFIVPPTKFLLGGNICDPLNLNSMQDEEINRAMNAVTPQSSPLPTPRHRKETIEVLIPPNIHDPLNLSAPDDDPNYELRLISPKKKKPRHRRRKSATAVAAAEEAKPTETEKAPRAEGEAEEVKKPEDSTASDKKTPARRSGEGRGNERKALWPARRSLDDKIVSPVIPQPGAWKRPPPIFNRNLSWEHHNVPKNKKNHRHRNKNRTKSESQEAPVFKPGNAKFQYGNYNRYYGYRNANQEIDARMKCFRKDMFHGKEVLDIGCNVGHVTLSVAQQFGARKVVGIDIDRKLVLAAKKNIRHYASCQPADCSERFPACMPVLYGTLDAPVVTGTAVLKFPHNVSFIHGNYVLDSELLLGIERPQFDVILCLSVTKWFHLNFGDEGLKRAFRRMHLQLRPGGRLILEPQPWSSYTGKKKLTETIYKNFKNIQFFPQQFTEYLLSSEVGFTKCEVIGNPPHHSRGFQRPIQMFTKAELPHNSPSETVPSTACGDAALPTETSVIRPGLDAVPRMAEDDEEEWEVAPEFADERQQEEPTPEPEEPSPEAPASLEQEVGSSKEASSEEKQEPSSTENHPASENVAVAGCSGEGKQCMDIAVPVGEGVPGSSSDSKRHPTDASDIMGEGAPSTSGKSKIPNTDTPDIVSNELPERGERKRSHFDPPVSLKAGKELATSEPDNARTEEQGERRDEKRPRFCDT